MPQILISYDLTGPQEKRETFQDAMFKSGWSDHIQRDGEFERLPNTTLISDLSHAEGIRTFKSALNKASLDGAGDFAATRWTLTGFVEIDGGVRETAEAAKAAETKAGSLLKTTRET